MTPEKWRGFRIALVIFAIVVTAMIYDQGGFTSMGPAGVAILLIAFAAVAYFIYLYLKKAPDDDFDR